MGNSVEIDAVAHSVAAMVVFLEGTVLAAGGGVLGIPHIGGNLAERVNAFWGNGEPSLHQLGGHDGNTL